MKYIIAPCMLLLVLTVCGWIETFSLMDDLSSAQSRETQWQKIAEEQKTAIASYKEANTSLEKTAKSLLDTANQCRQLIAPRKD
jgi:hypothetical protein